MSRTTALALITFVSFAAPNPVFAGFNDRLPPEAYVLAVDQQIAATGKGIKGRPYPCSLEKFDQGIDIIESLPTDRCVKMSAPNRWQGIWLDEFEGSRFCPKPARICAFNTVGDRIWLDIGKRKARLGGVYVVDFVGRKTLFKGPYGHMGLSDHEIIVDRVISIRTIKPPPPDMTEAEFVADMKSCIANGTCIPSKEGQAIIDKHEKRRAR
jgi:hypothetical protein